MTSTTSRNRSGPILTPGNHTAKKRETTDVLKQPVSCQFNLKFLFIFERLEINFLKYTRLSYKLPFCTVDKYITDWQLLCRIQHNFIWYDEKFSHLSLKLFLLIIFLGEKSDRSKGRIVFVVLCGNETTFCSSCISLGLSSPENTRHTRNNYHVEAHFTAPFLFITHETWLIGLSCSLD